MASLLTQTIPGGGNGNPLQYSCLENPMDRGAWQATVHGVAKSRTGLSDLTLFLSFFLSVLNTQSGFCFPGRFFEIHTYISFGF